MAFAFSFSEINGETAVDLEMMLEDDGPNRQLDLASVQPLASDEA